MAEAEYREHAGAASAPSTSPASPRGRAIDVLRIAYAGALVAALIFVGRWGYVWYVRRELVGVTRDLGWAAPLATLGIWMPVALVAAFAARWVPHSRALRLAGFVFFTLTALSTFIPVGGLARPAVAMLSLGIGVAVGRWLAESPGAVRVLGRIAAVATVALVAVALTFPRIERETRFERTERTERGERRATTASAADGARNVLIIVLDAVRADALHAYGSPRTTSPTIDRLAREGVRFSQAIATAPWTRPTHRTLLTGHYPPFWPGGVSTFLARMDQDSTPRLAERFRARGYATGAFVANFFYTGWDAGFAHGFSRYRDLLRTPEQVFRTSTLGQTMLARSLYRARSIRDVWQALVDNDFSVPPRPLNAEKTATVVTNEFLAWHAEIRAPRFMAFLNYFDAHLPYDPPAPFDTLFSTARVPRDLYDGAVAYMDAEVGRLLSTLEARGVLDETLVIVTSDHGELFGEHGLYEHSSNLYHKLLHVPLVVRLPGRVPSGRVVDQVVSLRDVAATIVDLALPRATTAPHRSEVPGRSLAALWDSVGGIRVSAPLALVERGVRSDSTLPFTKGDMTSLYDSAWHYIHNHGTGRVELYRYREDPLEARDWSAEVPDSIRRRFGQAVDSLLLHHGLGLPPSGRGASGAPRTERKSRE